MNLLTSLYTVPVAVGVCSPLHITASFMLLLLCGLFFAVSVVLSALFQSSAKQRADAGRSSACKPARRGKLYIVAMICTWAVPCTSEQGRVSTLAGSGSSGAADGTGASASFNNPTRVAVSPDGLNLFVADYANHNVRQVCSHM